MSASQLSTKDLERWRGRIRHAQDVWREHGLVGDSEMSTMRALLDFYRGEQWGGFPTGWCGLGSKDLISVNKVFSSANTLQAFNAARNPRIQAFPRGRKGAASARKVEHLVNYDIEELNMIRPFNAALRDHEFSPMGIVRHGFTPKRDFYDKEGNLLQTYGSARPDKPWIKRIPVWDCFLDPLAESFHDDGGMRWCAFRSLMTVEQIEKSEGMTLRKGVQPSVGNDWKQVRSRDLLDEQNEDFSDFVEVFTIYEAIERTWFQITLGGETKPLREQGDWPIPWERLPVNVFTVNEQMDTPFAVPLLSQLLPLQVEYNKVRSIMSILIKNLRRLVGVQQTGMEDAEYDKLVNADVIEFFKVKGIPSQVIQQIQMGGFPQELLFYIGQIEEDIREVIGQSKMDKAQRINVESAAEANRVSVGSDMLSARIQSVYEAFMQSTLRLYIQGRRVTTQEDELIPILGGEGAGTAAEPFVDVSVEEIQGEYDFNIVVGSTLPKDHAREAQAALADLEVAKAFPDLSNIPEHLRAYHVARGNDPQRMMTTPDQRQATDADLAARGIVGEEGGAQQGGASIDPIMALSGMLGGMPQ